MIFRFRIFIYFRKNHKSSSCEFFFRSCITWHILRSSSFSLRTLYKSCFQRNKRFSIFLTFFPQHFLRASGIPRRYCDYTEGFVAYHWLSTIGSLISVFGLVLYFVVLLDAFSRQIERIASEHSYETITLKINFPSN